MSVELLPMRIEEVVKTVLGNHQSNRVVTVGDGGVDLEFKTTDYQIDGGVRTHHNSSKE